MGRYYQGYGPEYVPVAEHRRRAAHKIAEMKQAGQHFSPVELVGRKITTTFWGDAWCKNLEAYSDYSNRLPRGRTYVRNGSVINLQIESGRIHALVSGTRLYMIDIKIQPLPKQKWIEITGKCSGQIGSLVELLQGSISKSVMEIVTRKGEGLFPTPREITLSCSCPDWATMCKHVAATLYGVGARLDHEPELLFTVRGVDPIEMVAAAIDQPTGAGKAGKSAKGRVLKTDELSSVFGIDIAMDGMSSDAATAATKPAKRTRRAAKARKPAASKTNKKKTAAKPAAPKTAATKKKSTTEMATPGKAAAKKTKTKKAAARKPAAKKNTASTSTGTKSTKKKTANKKTANKKTANKKTANKKTANKKTANKKTPMKTAETSAVKKATKRAIG